MRSWWGVGLAAAVVAMGIAFGLGRGSGDGSPPIAARAAAVASEPGRAASRPAPRPRRAGPRTLAAPTPEARPASAAPAEPAPLDDAAIQREIAQGEAAFEAGDAEGAFGHYLAVLEADPDHRLAGYSLYKLAWLEYNLGNRRAAMNDMRLLLAWTDGSDGELDGQLATEAAKDLARFEAEAADPAEPITGP